MYSREHRRLAACFLFLGAVCSRLVSPLPGTLPVQATALLPLLLVGWLG
jgi:hypothetical protein